MRRSLTLLLLLIGVCLADDNSDDKHYTNIINVPPCPNVTDNSCSDMAPTVRQTADDVGHLTRMVTDLTYMVKDLQKSLDEFRNELEPCMCNGTKPDPCRDIYCAHGYCHDGHCMCDPGWSGPKCDSPTSHCRVPCVHGRCHDDHCDCDPGWSGPGCDSPISHCHDWCEHGHCDPHGHCQCDPGWSGKYCDSPVDNCHHLCIHGHCDPNGQCHCDPGWSGRYCDSPIGNCDHMCIHGHCDPNGLCHCDPGWSGRYCDSPIGNECNYTCIHGECDHHGHCHCDPGWSGKYCDSPAGHDCNFTCIHGRCHDGHCDCDPGWSGRYCDSPSGRDCNYTCIHGECDEHGHCHCDPGWSGRYCDSPIAPICNFTCIHGECDQHGRCHCDPGWTGKYCDSPITPSCNYTCIHGECDEHGHCHCRPGWTGKYCDSPIGPSCNYTCIHGECDEYGYCHCRPGWTGKYCDSPIGPSCNYTCIHGECDEDGHCHCRPGWTGKYCDSPIGPSCNYTCIHGECDEDGHCHCRPGWTGKYCDTPTDSCFNVTCHHGYCEHGFCHCDPGWCGPDCNAPVDPCFNVTCRHGACEHGQCHCDPGWSGPQCDTPIDPCLNVTCFHGYCHVGHCHCDSGWTGDTCDTSIDPCDNMTCHHNGTCNNGTCECIEPWMGPFCDVRNNCSGAISPLPCLYGNCTNTPTGHVCHCKAGWTGPRCDTPICSDHGWNPCHHDGNCTIIDGPHFNYTCHCPPGYTGRDCDTNINECLKHPCGCGSTCHDTGGGYYCQCKQGFTGDDCCEDIDECLHHPCLNGGTCINSVGSYRCECPRGTKGPNCNETVHCHDDTCGENAQCYICDQGLCCVCKPGTTGDPYRKCSTHQSHSCGSGDPHYRTYDDAHFDYQGTCQYVFTEPCDRQNLTNTPYFQVSMENTPTWGNSRVSYVSGIDVFVYGQSIHLARKHKVSVNSERVYLPYYYPDRHDYKFKIINHGYSGVLLHTDFFLDVEYASSRQACVYTPEVPDLSGRLCGLAGNMNGNPKDDFRLPNGTVVSHKEETLFGDSWVIGATDNCELGSDMDPAPCSPTNHAAARVKCEILTNATGPFAPCSELGFVNSLFGDCVYDMCVYKNKEDVYCAALENFAQRCQKDLPGTVLHWRSADFCPLHCGPHQHYDACADACPMTCGDLRAGTNESKCDLSCTDGCACDYGFVFDGQGNCVAAEDCGCIDPDGHYYPGHSSWLNGNCSTEYSCTNGTISSSTTHCVKNSHCLVKNDRRDCYCDLGFQGDGQTNCTDIDECKEPGMCVHGTCINEPGSYKCNCDPNYSGPKCDKYIDYCREKPCKNGGTCDDTGYGFTCHCKDGFTGEVCQFLPARHCADLRTHYGIRTSGIHDGRLANGSKVFLYCDMTTDGGGWTLFQKRDTGLLDFYKNWTDFKDGFGDLNKEFWMGNELLTTILNSDKATQSLRADLTYCNRQHIYEEYRNFMVGDEGSGYKLTLGSAKGTGGNSLAYPNMFFNQNGMKFSTADRDNDNLSTGSCAKRYGGGFWFNSCCGANMNGKYYLCEEWNQQQDSIFWLTYQSDNTPAINVELKFRPTYFRP